MYIEPNTEVRVLADCPLDSTYEHTILFESSTQQELYFMNYTKRVLSPQTYQRVNSGSMRVAMSTTDLYNCNYLMFKNSSFEDKWFYAFIKSVNYVNNVTSEIEYEIDVMQTWHFQYRLGECFVEREHTRTDEIGEHTVPEGLETGPYVMTSLSTKTVTDLHTYIMATEKLGDFPWNDPGLVGGFPISCYWLSLGRTVDFTTQLIREVMEVYEGAGKGDSIVAVFTVPSNMASTTSVAKYEVVEGASRALTITPKNNKLYSYPYCCLAAHTSGQGIELRYELFNYQRENPLFYMVGGFGPNMEVLFCPLGYGGGDASRIDFEHALTVTGFPLCPWVKDYYQNWLAQNKASIVLGITSGIASTVASAVTGSAGGVVGGVSNVLGQIASVHQHSIIPDQMVGTASAPDIMATARYTGLYTYCKAITPEYANIIDGFFTRYGYKVNTVKVPNRHNRRYWTYTKTIDCVVKGELPCDDKKKIASIFDSGVTFWQPDATIGEYTGNNYVLGGVVSE